MTGFERYVQLLGYPLVIWSGGGDEMGIDHFLHWYDVYTGYILSG